MVEKKWKTEMQEWLPCTMNSISSPHLPLEPEWSKRESTALSENHRERQAKIEEWYLEN